MGRDRCLGLLGAVFDPQIGRHLGQHAPDGVRRCLSCRLGGRSAAVGDVGRRGDLQSVPHRPHRVGKQGKPSSQLGPEAEGSAF